MRLAARIAVVVVALVASGCGKPSEDEVWRAIKVANYCTRAADCTVVDNACFLSNIVNVKEAARIQTMTDHYQGCMYGALDMRDLSRLSCMQGKCVAAMKGGAVAPFP